MRWTPLSVETTLETSPTRRRNVASSKGFCIWPRVKKPRSPEAECEEQSDWVEAEEDVRPGGESHGASRGSIGRRRSRRRTKGGQRRCRWRHDQRYRLPASIVPYEQDAPSLGNCDRSCLIVCS
jgi:hypothetical protein